MSYSQPPFSMMLAPFHRSFRRGSITPTAPPLAEPRLRDAGFPMAKFPAVRAAIVGHMFGRSPGLLPEGIVLHDADTLDFLGATGVARRLAVTGEAADLDAGLARIGAFARDLPSHLTTRSARKLAEPRVRAMRLFLRTLNLEGYGRFGVERGTAGAAPRRSSPRRERI